MALFETERSRRALVNSSLFMVWAVVFGWGVHHHMNSIRTSNGPEGIVDILALLATLCGVVWVLIVGFDIFMTVSENISEWIRIGKQAPTYSQSLKDWRKNRAAARAACKCGCHQPDDATLRKELESGSAIFPAECYTSIDVQDNRR